MRAELRQQLSQLQTFFEVADKPFPNMPGASIEELSKVTETTGIQLDGDIVDLYQYMNGSEKTALFAVFTDEVTLCTFLSLDSALQFWGISCSDIDDYYQRVNRQYEDYEQEPARDTRIQPDAWVNKRWFPFAEFNGGGTIVYWDADPTPAGQIGQIIAYQHDPDAIYYVAPDFLTFIKQSNELLANNPKLLEWIYV